MESSDYSTPTTETELIYRISDETIKQANLDGNGVVLSIGDPTVSYGTIVPFALRGIHVEGQVTTYVNQVLPTQNIAYYGYGYFEDGVNPSEDYVGTDAYMSSQSELFIPEANDFSIPLNNAISGVTTSLYDVNNNLLSSYTTVAKTEYDEVAHYLYASSSVYSFDVDGTVFKVNRICEPKYTPIKMKFINKAGFYDELWFFKNSNVSLETKEESYRSNILRNGSYSDYNHQYRTLYKEGRESLTINSGYYPESHNEIFRQLLLSEYVWVTYNNYNFPCRIKDSSMSFKTQIQDKLINYTMNIEFAFDKINSVR